MNATKINLIALAILTALAVVLVSILFIKREQSNWQDEGQRNLMTTDTVTELTTEQDITDLRDITKSALDVASVPSSWLTVVRKDLAITLRLPPDYQESGSAYIIPRTGQITGVIALKGNYHGEFLENRATGKKEPPFLSTPSGLLLQVVPDSSRGNGFVVARLKLPYLSSSEYLYFEFPKQDISMFAQIIAGVGSLIPDPTSFKSYTSTDLGFQVQFPINKKKNNSMFENFQPGTKGSFSVGLMSGPTLRTFGKDYTCECDAGPKSLNNKFPTELKYEYPTSYFTNKYGVEYAIMSGIGRPEDDVLGEALHMGEKVYILKTNNSDFPVINIVTYGPIDEIIAQYIVDSFEWL